MNILIRLGNYIESKTVKNARGKVNKATKLLEVASDIRHDEQKDGKSEAFNNKTKILDEATEHLYQADVLLQEFLEV